MAPLPPRLAPGRPRLGTPRRSESRPDLGLRSRWKTEGMADAIQRRPLVGNARRLEAGSLRIPRPHDRPERICAARASILFATLRSERGPAQTHPNPLVIIIHHDN